MCEIAATRMRYGYRKIRVLLLREGYQVSKNRLYRLYREEGLSLRYRSNRKRRAQKPPGTCKVDGGKSGVELRFRR